MNLPFKLVAVAALGGAIWFAWPEQARTAPAAAIDAAAPTVANTPRSGLSFFAPVGSAPVSAAASMAATRLHGDPDAPPIAHAPVAHTPPSAQELADPQAYAAYEARETRSTYAAYIRAVDEELPRLRADIARGRAMGIDADKIAMAEDKARRLGMMRAQLVQELQAAHSPLTTAKD